MQKRKYTTKTESSQKLGCLGFLSPPTLRKYLGLLVKDSH